MPDRRVAHGRAALGATAAAILQELQWPSRQSCWHDAARSRCRIIEKLDEEPVVLLLQHLSRQMFQGAFDACWKAAQHMLWQGLSWCNDNKAAGGSYAGDGLGRAHDLKPGSHAKRVSRPVGIKSPAEAGQGFWNRNQDEEGPQ
jgi:hypothetical protein